MESFILLLVILVNYWSMRPKDTDGKAPFSSDSLKDRVVSWSISASSVFALLFVFLSHQGKGQPEIFVIPAIGGLITFGIFYLISQSKK